MSPMRFPTRTFAAACLVAVGAAAGIAAPARASASRAPGRWVMLTSGAAENLAGIACPSVCYAMGAHATLIKTVDGGRSWIALDNPEKTYKFEIDGIACPSVRVCYVGSYDTTIIGTKDGGRTWAVQHDGSGNEQGYSNDEDTYAQTWFTSVYGLSCVTETRCVAVGSSGYTYITADGLHWTELRSSVTHDVLGDVQCPTASACIAVGARPCPEPGLSYCTWTVDQDLNGGGSVARTTDGGATGPALGYRFDGVKIANVAFNGVTCMSARSCRVVGYAGGQGRDHADRWPAQLATGVHPQPQRHRPQHDRVPPARRLLHCGEWRRHPQRLLRTIVVYDVTRLERDSPGAGPRCPAPSAAAQPWRMSRRVAVRAGKSRVRHAGRARPPAPASRRVPAQRRPVPVADR